MLFVADQRGCRLSVSVRRVSSHLCLRCVCARDVNHAKQGHPLPPRHAVANPSTRRSFASHRRVNGTPCVPRCWMRDGRVPPLRFLLPAYASRRVAAFIPQPGPHFPRRPWSLFLDGKGMSASPSPRHKGFALFQNASRQRRTDNIGGVTTSDS